MKKYLVVFFIALLIVGLDQLTKYILCETLPLHHRIEVFENFFHIVHIRNPGIAFGLFTQAGTRFKIPLLIFISGVAIGVICYFIFQIKGGSWLQTLCFSLLLGGAAGNLIDRFRFGEVIDFIDLHWYSAYHWPAFNVADSAISAGIILLALDALLGFRRESKKHRKK